METEAGWMAGWLAFNSANGAQLSNDRSVFGPELTSKTPSDLAEEIKQVMLSSNSDYLDAVVFADKGLFLVSDPCDCVIRSGETSLSLLSSIYAAVRSLFLGFSFELAMSRASNYLAVMRALRSLVYITETIEQEALKIQDERQQQTTMRRKLDATVMVLRRQLEDFHGKCDSVGRGLDGTFAARAGKGLSLHDAAKVETTESHVFLVVVQLESASMFRSKLPVLSAAVDEAQQIIASNAAKFSCTRSNYFSADGSDDPSKLNSAALMNRSYIFTTTESWNAVGFAGAVHKRLNSDGTKWPSSLIAAKRYNRPLWRGLTARIGIHYGTPDKMDVDVDDEAFSTVVHWEGVAVEKALRTVALGASGDTCISQFAWDAWNLDFRAAQVPTTPNFAWLRSMVHFKQPCPRRHGFRKSEDFFRVFECDFAARAEEANKNDAEFGNPYFFKIEASDIDGPPDDEAVGPTLEETLLAKSTELAVVQQELDVLRLAVIKRDEDIKEAQTKLYFSIACVEQRGRIKETYLMDLSQQLESSLMARHDVDSNRLGPPPLVTDWDNDMSLPSPSPASTTSLEMSSIRKQQLMHDAGVLDVKQAVSEYVNGLERQRKATLQAKLFGPTTVPPEAPLGVENHKNQRLWRKLMTMVDGVNSKVDPTRNDAALARQQRAAQFAKKDRAALGHHSASMRSNASSAHNSSSDFLSMMKVHQVVRTFDSLTKRFVVENYDEQDCDTKGLSEDQFLSLFLRSVVDKSSIRGLPREQLQWLTTVAIETEESEQSCRFDEARLSRSISGHLANLFILLRNMKKLAAFGAHTAQIQESKSSVSQPTTPRAKGRSRRMSHVGTMSGGSKMGSNEMEMKVTLDQAKQECALLKNEVAQLKETLKRVSNCPPSPSGGGDRLSSSSRRPSIVGDHRRLSSTGVSLKDPRAISKDGNSTPNDKSAEDESAFTVLVTQPTSTFAGHNVAPRVEPPAELAPASRGTIQTSTVISCDVTAKNTEVTIDPIPESAHSFIAVTPPQSHTAVRPLSRTNDSRRQQLQANPQPAQTVAEVFSSGLHGFSLSGKVDQRVVSPSAQRPAATKAMVMGDFAPPSTTATMLGLLLRSGSPTARDGKLVNRASPVRQRQATRLPLLADLSVQSKEDWNAASLEQRQQELRQQLAAIQQLRAGAKVSHAGAPRISSPTRNLVTPHLGQSSSTVQKHLEGRPESRPVFGGVNFASAETPQPTVPATRNYEPTTMRDLLSRNNSRREIFACHAVKFQQRPISPRPGSRPHVAKQ